MNYEQLSKELSYMLRHAPEEYGIELDQNGFTSLDNVIAALQEESRWNNISINDIKKAIDCSSKKRHEIVGNRIRAIYGHSINQKIESVEKIPPNYLYHGTTHKAAEIIKEEGLTPQARQYIHLSEDKETALEVGKRRESNPVLFQIDSKLAYQEGIKFYHGNENIWLSEVVPSRYLKIVTLK